MSIVLPTIAYECMPVSECGCKVGNRINTLRFGYFKDKIETYEGKQFVENRDANKNQRNSIALP